MTSLLSIIDRDVRNSVLRMEVKSSRLQPRPPRPRLCHDISWQWSRSLDLHPTPGPCFLTVKRLPLFSAILPRGRSRRQRGRALGQHSRGNNLWKEKAKRIRRELKPGEIGAEPHSLFPIIYSHPQSHLAGAREDFWPREVAEAVQRNGEANRAEQERKRSAECGKGARGGEDSRTKESP